MVKPKLIILRGPPAVGKTTIEKSLYNHLQFIKVDPDEIMNGKTITINDYPNFARRVDSELSQKNNVVVTGIFWDDLLYNHFLQYISVECVRIIINLWCSFDTLVKRDKERGKNVPLDKMKEYYSLLESSPTYKTKRVNTERQNEEIMADVIREINNVT